MTDQNALDSEFFSSRQVSKARGGVSPVAHPAPLRTIIDLALNDYDVVWAAAGHPHAVYPTTYDELLRITAAQAMVVGDYQ